MFNKKTLALSVASVLLATQASVAVAQESADSGASLVLEEVVVTALRREQDIQDVPMTVTAITAQDVQDYNLFRFEDLDQLSPGLSLENKGAFGSVAQLRGVGFDSNASTAPAVDIYLNDSPVDANYAFQSIYDIGQVEVLRGPQGTLRGRPAPGGALTLVTRRPDLEQMGGTFSGSASDQDLLNAQGGLNVPVIKDQLALRFAGVYEENEAGGLESVNSGVEDERETNSWRLSARWNPNDMLDATLTHQQLESDLVNLSAVNGPGAGYNGPAINGASRKSVQEGESGGEQEFQLTSLNIDLDLDGHRVIYAGAHQDNSFDYEMEFDIYNAVTNWEERQFINSDFEVDNHELRLVSDTPDAFMDYVVGLWYQKTKTATTFRQPAPQPGAFGNPLTPSPVGPPNMDYVIDVSGYIPTNEENYAIYSNTVMHLTERTDLSLGARYLENENKRGETLNTSAALIDVGIAPGVPIQSVCESLVDAGFGFNGQQPWPGYCMLELDAATYDSPATEKDGEWVYQASLAHNFTDDVMAYFTYAHSWRPAGVTVGITAPVNDPALVQGDAEESDSFELGLRSDWLDGRLRTNVSVFHQEFDNFVGRFNNVPVVGAGDQIVNSTGFTYPGDALVDGAEVDLTYEINDNWWVQWTSAYADGHYDDARVPCRDTDLDGAPDNGDIGDLTLPDFGGNSVIYCTVDDPISTVPEWINTVQSEYSFPLLGGEGYVRALYNHFSEEDYGGTQFEADAYGLLNLYVGVRDLATHWEVSLWARNVFDEDTQLDGTDPQTWYGAFPTGYAQVSYLPEREVGLTVRYIFGDG